MNGNPRYAYFIEAKGCGLVKIGVTDNLDTRFRGLWTQSPVELVLLGAIPDGTRVEWFCHQTLARYRKRGEWFRLTPVTRAFIAWVIERSADRWEDEGLSDELPPFRLWDDMPSALARFEQGSTEYIPNLARDEAAAYWGEWSVLLADQQTAPAAQRAGGAAS